jgi:methylamine utilization protein MauE
VTPDAIAPPFFLAAVLLALSGALKLRRPRPSAQALLDVGLPGSDGLGRGLGVVEVAAAAGAILAPAAGGALALAVAYAGFSAFLAYVLRRHPDAGSCGCVGTKALPPSALHLALDVVAAGIAVAYAAAAGPSAASWFESLGFPGALAVMGGLVLAGAVAIVAVIDAPSAWRAWSPPPHVHDAHRGDDHDASADAALASAGIGPGHPSLWPGVASEASA